jgi:type IV secretory pathway VirB2 component (pilin)
VIVNKIVPAALVTLFASGRATAQFAAPDPAGSGPIIGAVEWLQGTLLGNVATAVAVIAVAAVGFMMLTGESTGNMAQPSSSACSSCSAQRRSSAASARSAADGRPAVPRARRPQMVAGVTYPFFV